MFQNTRLAMEQLIEAMNEAVSQGPEGIREFFQDMDRSEKQALSDIFNMCEDYMNLADELEEAKESEGIS
jgi:hypothetical protein